MIEENKADWSVFGLGDSDQNKQSWNLSDQDLSFDSSSAKEWSYVNLDMIDKDIESFNPDENKIVLWDDGIN